MSLVHTNNLFPVFLKLENFRVLIVGGGKVGLEKVSAVLINSPETVLTIISIDFTTEILDFLKDFPHVTVIKRGFENSDLDGVDFLIVAIDDKQKSIEIKQEAKRRAILANVADTPDHCDFYLGSIVRKGDLKIAISTNGKSPTIAKRIREMFEETFPDDIQKVLDNLTEVRKHLSGDFNEKINQLNSITSVLSSNPNKIKGTVNPQKFRPIYLLYALLLVTLGFVFGNLFPLKL